MTSKPPIIIASAHLFRGALTLGSAHLARCFAEAGYPTLYLNSPTSPLHFANPRARAAARSRFAAVRPRKTDVPNLIELTPLALVPHHNTAGLKAEATLRNWPRLTVPDITRAIADAGFGNAAAMLFDTVMFWPLAQRLGCPTIYRLADRIDGFSVNTQAMIALHRTVVREADLLIYTASDLAPAPGERSRPSLLLPNGVRYELFLKPQARPAEYEGIRGPIVVYAGALETWFDADAVTAAADRYPEATFIILGPASRGIEERLTRPNIRCLGARPHEQLPAFFQHAHVGTIPFDIARHGPLLDAVSPLKLFEYLASGLGAVCYGGREIARLGAPALLYDPRPGSRAAHTSFGDALATAFSTLPATDEDVKERQAFARQADWAARFATLESAVQDAGLLPKIGKHSS
jgi:hypothetical protein